jgi:hypothetical protein
MFNVIRRFISGIIYKYIKPWFFSGDDPDRIKAPYVISFVFLSLTVWAIVEYLIMKMWQFREMFRLWEKSGVNALPQIEAIARIDFALVPLITVLIGTAGMFIGLYNWGKKKSGTLKQALKADNAAGDGDIDDDEI